MFTTWFADASADEKAPLIHWATAQGPLVSSSSPTNNRLLPIKDGVNGLIFQLNTFPLLKSWIRPCRFHCQACNTVLCVCSKMSHIGSLRIIVPTIFAVRDDATYHKNGSFAFSNFGPKISFTRVLDSTCTLDTLIRQFESH